MPILPRERLIHPSTWVRRKARTKRELCAAGRARRANHHKLPSPLVQPFSGKYSSCRFARNTSRNSPSDPTEGRIAIVTDAGLDAVDAAASGAQVNCRAGFGLSQTRERSNGAQTNGAEADGKAVWSWHPLLVSSWRRHVGPTGRGYSVNSPMTVTRRIRRRGEYGGNR